MRIAVVNWNGRKIGGAETYIAQLLQALRDSGEELAFWCEIQAPADRESVAPAGIPVWCVEEIGRAEAFAALRGWRPELLLVHGLTRPENEAELQSIAPAAFFAHNYYGTCITGAKTINRPGITPCERQFGVACLGHFYPNRCGGLNPLTALGEFRVQSRRNDLLRGYRAVFCASSHMRREYVRNGVAAERLHLAPYPVESWPGAELLDGARSLPAAGLPRRVLFAGRLERQKGGDMLLRALPHVVRATAEPLSLVVAGEGAERPSLERIAAEVTAAEPRIRVSFEGWTSRPGLGELMREADVLALPSVWPEPFGLIGLEAGRFGVPTAAFAVGGIPDWLQDGGNGALAPADPATPERFAAALVRCLDGATYPGLSAGAREASLRYTLLRHLELVRPVLYGAAGIAAPAPPAGFARS